MQIPTRVPYPGKKAILEQIMGKVGGGEVWAPARGTASPHKKQDEDSNNGDEIEVQYRIGFFKDGFRLKAIDQSDNVLQEALLPPLAEGLNYMIIESDGQQYFPMGGDMSKFTLCSQYLSDNLPKPVLPKTTSMKPGSLGDPPSPKLPSQKLPTMDSDSDTDPVAEAESSPKMD